ncbi:glucosyltransferase domain-containing protein [Enterobacter quasihormaechei]|uniref:glucosyltransferase domain-containing protein n=1 Tax=Enterobacter quasihormaechei TaxID=2529382 RepID=UPI002FD348E0
MLGKVTHKNLTIKDIYLLYFIMGMVFTMPILMANVYYVDDLMRASTGILGWVTLGRPLTDISFQSLSASSQAVDIFPLGLILSVTVLSASSTVLIVTSGMKKTLMNALIFALIWFNPMMLQNLSYRFDSLSMSLSMLLCVFASHLIFKKNNFLMLFSSLVLIGSLSLYQPSIFMFLSCFTLIWLCKTSNQDLVLKDVILTAMKATLSFFLAYLSYSKFILPYISFSSTRSELIFPSSRPFEHISLYFIAIFNQLESIYDSGYETCLIILSISLFAGLTTFMKSSIANDTKKSLFIIILIISPIACFLLTFMPTAILKEAITAPRVFMSFGFIISCIFIVISKSKFVFPIAFLSYAIPTLALSFSYGNALKQQSDYDNIAALEIMRSIDGLKENAIIYGVNDSPLIVQQIVSSKPFLKYLLSPSYDWTMSLRLQNLNTKNISFAFDRKNKNHVVKIACDNKYKAEIITGNIISYSVNGYKLISLSGELPCK